MTRRSRGTGTVFLRTDRRGAYQLVDARRRPIAQANRFLTAVAVRGLSCATVRAYGFDLVILYRWFDRSQHSLASLRHLLLLETRSDHGDLYLIAHRLILHCAEDDVCIFVCRILNNR